MENVYIDECYETCVSVLRSGAMWRPRRGHINAIFHGQCHVETFFIRPLRNVAADGFRQKLLCPRWHPTWQNLSSAVATVAFEVATLSSYVDCVWAMMWRAMSSAFWAVWDFKVCSL
jgi:hypothetical protein